MIDRRRVAVALAVALAALGSTPAASADTADLVDPAADVTLAESETAATEPRVDITLVEVDHRARSLEIAITVEQFTPLTDAAWDGPLAFQAVLGDESDENTWLWSFVPDGDGGATGDLLSFSDFSGCETGASADEEGGRYVLTTGSECLRGVPRSVRVGTVLQYDPDPDDDDFDTPFDMAPDDELSDLIGSAGGAAQSRIAGPDRVETAIALSADRFDDAGAPAAVLVSSGDFPDAVAGGPLAAFTGGPLLLTGGDELDGRVAAELERAVEPGAEVFLLGGTSVLGDDVATRLRELGFRPRRLAGDDRFATAVAVADEIGDHPITLVADGRSFRDGLVAGAAAAALGGVVVLSDGSTMPDATDDFLANDPARHVAVGTGAAAAAPGAERIVAGDATALSQKVLDRLLPSVGTIAVAGQGAYADALAGAPHVASLGGGLLLTDGDELSAATRAELTQRRDTLREVVLYGGTAAISTGVEEAITTLLAAS